MSDVSNEDSDVNWNAVLDLLRQGKTAEIPCATERDYVRRAKRIGKRTEKNGIAVEVMRGEGVLLVQPRPAAGGTGTAGKAGDGAESGAERRERREARQAGRSRDE